ncbi:hypothetical protein JG687_00015562, partial [Phytophthora cactorum]
GGCHQSVGRTVASVPAGGAQRLRKAYRKTVRSTPESIDALCLLLEPLYYRKYGLPGSNLQYPFEHGLPVSLTYYGNGCSQVGDGIRDAPANWECLDPSQVATSRQLRTYCTT